MYINNHEIGILFANNIYANVQCNITVNPIDKGCQRVNAKSS